MLSGRRTSVCLLLGSAFLIMACLPIPFLSQGSAVLVTSTPGPASPTEAAQDTPAIAATYAPTDASSTDIITNAITAKDVSGPEKNPVGSTDSFPADQGIFHAVVTISNAPSGTRVRVAWMVVDDGNPSEANTKMAEYELTTDGSRNLDFSFTPSAGGLPAGDYKADVYLNGELDRSLGFSVAQADTNANTSNVVTNAVTAQDVQGSTFDPTGVTDTFPSNQSIFHAVVTISNAPSGTRVKVAWIVVDDGNPTDSNTQLGEYELSSEGSRNLDFTFKPNAGSLPPGNYRADVYLDGDFNRSLDFTVAAP